MDSRQLFLVPPPPEFSKVFHKHQQSTSQIMQQQQQPQCNICGTTEKLLRCAKCKAIYYCSTDHQHFDWPTHKQQCRALAKKRQINNHLQQLTNGCGAININCHSNALNSSANGTPTWSYRCTDSCYDNIKEPNLKSNSFVLGTSENEILNSKAETVTQNSDTSGYMGSFDANSTTSDQMHHIMVQNGLNLPYMHGVSKKSYNDNSLSYYPSIQTQFREDIIKHSTNTQQTDNENVADVLHQRNCIETKLLQQQHQHFLQQQTDTQYPVPQLSNHLTNQREKSSSYQIGAAVIGENFLENANERRYEELCRNIINDMNHYGLSVIDDFIGREKGLQILNEVDKMYSAGVFKDGQLVNNLKSEQDLRTIRGDKITWVKGVESGCSNVGYLINQIDAVICRSNSMINNGKLGNYVIRERTKAMVACYPGSGSHYVMHVDNPNKDGRVITAIYYLNLNWDSKHSGGVLRIFPEQTKSVADIEPKFDRLIFFWSDKRNPHEVQPAHRTRYAITVWYFDANEREQALNRCKNAPHSIKSYKSNIGCVSQTDQNNATNNATSKASTAVNSNSASFSASTTTSPACTSILQRTPLPNKQTLTKDSFKIPAAIPNTTQNSSRPIQVVRPNSHK